MLQQQATLCVRTLTDDRRVKESIGDAIVRHVTVYCFPSTVAQIRTPCTRIHGGIQGADRKGVIPSTARYRSRREGRGHFIENAFRPPLDTIKALNDMPARAQATTQSVGVGGESCEVCNMTGLRSAVLESNTLGRTLYHYSKQDGYASPKRKFSVTSTTKKNGSRKSSSHQSQRL